MNTLLAIRLGTSDPALVVAIGAFLLLLAGDLLSAPRTAARGSDKESRAAQAKHPLGGT